MLTSAESPITADLIASSDLQSRFIDNGSKTLPDWLRQYKSESIDQLKHTGFPGKKNESWKYTDISKVYSYNLVPMPPSPAFDVETATHPVHIVFVNGFYMPQLSRLAPLGGNISVHSITSLPSPLESRLKRCLTQSVHQSKDSFASLNNLFLENGVFICSSKPEMTEQDLYISHYVDHTAPAISHHPRIILSLDAGNRINLIESFQSSGSWAGLVNHRTEIHLDSNSELSHYLIQDNPGDSYQVSNLFYHQAENSRISSHIFTAGGHLVRNNIHAELTGEQSDCKISGVSLLNKKQHLDNFTTIRHMAPKSTSSQAFHGVVSESSRNVFTGKIYVDRAAQQTAAYQSNRSLMLSDNAHVDARPQLEIFADDVSCRHGATVGQLDEASLIYLQSRGIDYRTAKQMLTLAFVKGVTDHYGHGETRERVEARLENKLEGKR